MSTANTTTTTTTTTTTGPRRDATTAVSSSSSSSSSQKKNWKKLMSNPPVSLSGVSKGVSNITGAVKESVTRGGVQHNEVPDTSSPVMDSKMKELDVSCSFMLAILKGMKKQLKCLKMYYEASDELSAALLAFSRSGFVSDDLSLTLDMLNKSETFHKNALVDLSNHNSKIHQQMKEWIKTSLPTARVEKKQFENQRRILDDCNLKVARIAAEEKKGEKAKLRMKELQQEKENAEDDYRKQGDKSYSKIVETLENTKFFFLNQLIVKFDGYDVFFQQGENFSTHHKPKMQEIKEKAAKEQQAFKMQPASRQKGIWASADIGGDNKRVFAMNYQHIVDRDKPPSQMPMFLDQCLTLIEQNGLKTPGLFRVSAPKPELDSLRDKIDKGMPLPVDEIKDDIHLITGLVKLFLRELPVPLLTFDLYPEWMSLVSLPKEEQPLKFRDLVLRLPHANAILLERLIHLCTKITEHTADNKMTQENLAIVLCPSILYEETPNPLTMVADIQKANGILVILCSHYQAIFEGITQQRPAGFLLPGPGSVSFVIPGTSVHTLPPLQTQSIPFSSPTQSGPPSLTRESNKERRPSNTLSSGSSGKVALGGFRTGTPKQLPLTPNQKNELSEKIKANVEAMIDATDTTTIEFQETEEKRGNITYVTLNPPPLALAHMYKLLENRESTTQHYYKFFELFEAGYVFTYAAQSLKEINVEELNILNAAFQVVAKAIKNMLNNIKEYSSKFPVEIGKRIAISANKVRPHIKSLISYVKAYNSGEKLDPSGIVAATRSFLLCTYQIFLTCHRASQMDELSQSAFKCLYIIKNLNDTLRDKKQSESSTLLNHLQNIVLRLTSLLRSRLPEMVEGPLQEQLSTIIEISEQRIGEIFDEARTMLEHTNLHMSHVFFDSLRDLNSSVLSVLALRPSIDEAIAVNHDISRTIDIVIEQLESVSEIHQPPVHPTIVGVLNQITALMTVLRTLRDHSLYVTAPDNPKQWLDECGRVITCLQAVKEIVESVANVMSPMESLREAFVGYTMTVDHFIIQFKIGISAVAFGLHVNGFESFNCMTPIRDFSFVSHPFLYNLLEAVSMMNNITAAGRED